MKKRVGFFITGTDTEVGKTLVSGALILKLNAAGIRTVGFKPVVAGTYLSEDGRPLNEDLETLRIASGLSLDEPDSQSLSPYVLEKPAAPHLVAQTEGVELSGDIILQSFQDVSTRYEAVIVEGAGGFLVPLNEQEDLGDIAQSINLPVILVVGMRLGCINHALLTYEAILARRLTIAGWIANTLSDEMPLLSENIQTLKNRIQAPYLGFIPALDADLQKYDSAPYSLAALQFAAEHISIPESHFKE